MSSASWMCRMQQRNTELDRFFPTPTSPRYGVAWQEGTHRLCSASATLQWMQSIPSSTEHPTADVKMLLRTIFIAERNINTFCIALPVVACSWCLLSTAALINMAKLQDSLKISTMIIRALPSTCLQPGFLENLWEAWKGKTLYREVSRQRKNIL